LKKRLIIIGAGPGGFYLASLIAEKSKEYEITLIEKEFLGGTCLNIGCIPTKALLDHISLFEHFKEAGKRRKIFNYKELDPENEINVEGLQSYQKEIIKQLQQGIEKVLKNKNIKHVIGEASFLTNSKILVKGKNSNTELKGDEIVIATGSQPRSVPSFELDRKLVVSSDEAWNIPKIPKSLLIVGTGPIGIEFARIFNALGTKVTMTEIQEMVCPILDKEMSENLVRSLKRRGIKTSQNVASKQIGKTSDTVSVKFISAEVSKETSEEFDQVLIAVGRKPNVESLKLENAGVELDKQGFINVDKFLKTTNNNIWAVGDVTNYPQLAHTASFQARVAVENILKGDSGFREFDSRFIPSCIYGYPEIAFVGETEEVLKEKKVSYKKGISLFLTSGKAKASGLTEGLVKILMSESTKEILGAHIIGPEASNLIHELVVAMQNGITVDKLANTIHAHPTYSETVHEALEDCLKIRESAMA